jgi:hypothetical protein
MKVGLVPMSAKPFHAGHDALIRLACRECEIVQVFVSLSNRERPGELPIYSKDMEVIWKKYIEKSLPENCMPPIYAIHRSPVTDMMMFLEKAEKEGSDDTFVIYADVKDIKEYTDKKLMPYMPTLLAAGQVQRRGIPRHTNISGTKMRRFIAAGDVVEFSKFLPSALQPHAQEIYAILAPK